MTTAQFPLSRVQLLQQAHPWMTTTQAHALLAFTYSKFLENYKGTDTNQLMDNWLAINTRAPEELVRNQLAVAAEWAVF